MNQAQKHALECIFHEIAMNAIATERLCEFEADRGQPDMSGATQRALLIMANHSGFLADFASSQVLSGDGGSGTGALVIGDALDWMLPSAAQVFRPKKVPTP